ncbi:MAG TPA: hypothetical protein PK141_00070 [Polyangiaceae bacterium]|nr:hypothetical protein [Polyangiaceae bacterium]
MRRSSPHRLRLAVGPLLLVGAGLASACHEAPPPRASPRVARGPAARAVPAATPARPPAPPTKLLDEPSGVVCAVEGPVTAPLELGDREGPLTTVTGASSGRFLVLGAGGAFVELRGAGLRARGFARASVFARQDLAIKGVLTLWKEAALAPAGGDAETHTVRVGLPELRGVTQRAPLPVPEVPCGELTTSAAERGPPSSPRFYVNLRGKRLELAATPGGPIVAEAHDLELAAVTAAQGAYWRVRWYVPGGELHAWTRAAGLAPRRGSDAELVNQLLAAPAGPTPAPPPAPGPPPPEAWVYRCERETPLLFAKDGRTVALVTLRPADLQLVGTHGELAEVTFAPPEFSQATIDTAPQTMAIAGATMHLPTEWLSTCSQRRPARQ